MSPATGRTRGAEPEPRVRRGLVRDRGARASFQVEFDLRTAYDFVISLFWHSAEYDRLPEDERWQAEARAALTDDQRADIEASFGDRGAGYALLGLVMLRPEIRTASDLAAVVAGLSARDYAHSVLEDQLLEPEAAALALRALDGDRAALRQLPRRLPDYMALPTMALLRHPDEAMTRLRRGLAAWLPHFQAIEARVGGILDRDLALRAGERASLPPVELIERVTGGLRFVPDPRVSRVVLAPTYFGRPFNELLSGPGWRLFCYPVADEALPADDPLAPPPQVLRFFRALGDASRLRILHLLTDRDLYLTEIATALELSKPTVKHHLAQLRAAGLVTVIEAHNLSYYSLRRERLREAGDELRAYLR
ncbi:MAG TPA: metalloregulator ArsR/SmtB family transcription factor [Candidatus Limnocylindrales bacterium]|nr:metalloregulator ArsR/SmtB family transcription factor [Candidatus Limnocylindrales bacterium]